MKARFLWLALACCFGGTLLLHAYLGRYAHPMADDFSYALKDVSQGAWAAALWEFEHWNGRFTSNFLVLFGPMRGGFENIWIYRLVPAALLVLALMGGYTLLRTLAPASPRRVALIGALLWTGLYAHLMPDMGEGFYWYTGSVTYQLPSALLLFAISALIHHQRTRAIWSMALGAALLVFCIGCNEVIMALIVVGTITTSIHRARAVRMSGPGWTILAIVIAASLVMILAPGNAARGSHFSGTHRLFPSIGMGFLQTMRFSATWVFCGSLFAISLLWWMSRAWLNEHAPQLARGFGLHPLVTALALGGTVFLCAFPAYWSTGILGQHRTMNVACFFFPPLWLINLSAWLTHFRWWRTSVPFAPPLALALLVLVFVDLGLSGNSKRALGDLLTGRAERSNEQLWRRYELLTRIAESGQPMAEVPTIDDPPRSLYVLNLRDPAFLVNQDYAAWFGLKEVRIAAGSQSVDANSTN